MKRIIVLFMIVLGTVINVSGQNDTIPTAFSVDEYLNQNDPELSENELKEIEEKKEITKIVRHLPFGFIPIVLFYDKRYTLEGDFIYPEEKNINFYYFFLSLLGYLIVPAFLTFGIFFLFGKKMRKYRLSGLFFFSIGLFFILLAVLLLFFNHIHTNFWDWINLPVFLGISLSVYKIYKNKKERRYLTV